jgi:signal transduction histidine kinase
MADKPAWHHSLAWRLTATYLLSTFLVVLALGAATYLLTAFYLDEQMGDELATQADFYAAYAAQLATDERTLAGVAPTVVGLFAAQADLNVRFFGADDGRLLAATQDIGPQPSQAALVELQYRSPTAFTRPSRDLPQRRYAARVVRSGERAIGVVEVSRSTKANERFLATLCRILLVALLVVVAISALVSVPLARRLSRPIRDVEQAARRIATGDLDIRLGSYPPDELGRLAASIDHMAGQLGQLQAARARFIGEISHDLRTPLAAIKGMLINLIDAAEPNQHAALEVAEQETDRLIRLVNQLLDFSRWQAGQLTLNRRPVDVGDVARTVIALVEGRASHRGLTLAAEIAPDLPTVLADPDRLERVILNLLDNACKFTPAGGDVSLTVAARDAEVEVAVQDTGAGMSEEERERAFEPYYRGREGSGTGLGLAIARAIVEAHDGRMGLESALSKGTRVWFALPL